jgi:hypothetical protein
VGTSLARGEPLLLIPIVQFQRQKAPVQQRPGSFCPRREWNQQDFHSIFTEQLSKGKQFRRP